LSPPGVGGHDQTTRVGYLGPEGTFSGEALRDSPLVADGVFGAVSPVPLPTIHDTVMAVADGDVDAAIVPIENSLEGSVDVVLDALALDAPEVRIVGEAIHPVRHCLIARVAVADSDVRHIASHPQVIGQCSALVRSLPEAEVVPTSSTAEAVRMVAAAEHLGWVALGNRLAAELYDCVVLREGVEDHPDNETRFVWLVRGEDLPARPAREAERFKTSLVFWGSGASGPGWLVSCLLAFSERSINLTRIESRPRGAGLGSYMFFADLEGSTEDARVAAAIDGLRDHCDEVRVLGSYPAA